MQSLLVVAAARYYRKRHAVLREPTFGSGVTIMSSVMLLLVAGNMVQVALWAMLFILVGEFPLFSAAFYHSAVNFATLGYGDVVMSEQHRLLGPLEAINGALMIGLSTAVLTAAFGDIARRVVDVRPR
jgi:hypothetical protein